MSNEGSAVRGGERPTCPFCDAAWTDDMLAHYDAASGPGGCACCGPPPTQRRVFAATPVTDIRCAECGRAIYRVAARAYPTSS